MVSALLLAPIITVQTRHVRQQHQEMVRGVEEVHQQSALLGLVKGTTEASVHSIVTLDIALRRVPVPPLARLKYLLRLLRTSTGLGSILAMTVSVLLPVSTDTAHQLLAHRQPAPEEMALSAWPG